jgi:hypothetical protein
VKNSGIEAADIRSLQFVLSGESISIGGSHGLLIGHLGNVILEVLFLDCSKSNVRMNLSELMNHRLIGLESVNLSILSFETLESLLLSESISVESEDALLLRHGKMTFLSEDGLSRLDEHFKIPPESV